MRVNLIKLVVVVIDDQLGNVQDGLTLDSLSRRRFTDAEYEARVSSLNKSQRVPYEKIIEYTRAVLEYRTGLGPLHFKCNLLLLLLLLNFNITITITITPKI